MKPFNRRNFLAVAGVSAIAARTPVLGANDRIRLGAIGTGGRCQYLLSLLQNLPGNQVVAICDVYEPHRTQARLKYASYATEYTDYRKLLENREIDAVIVGAPDHWHAPITMDAVRAGKDVYVEKPVTHKLEEGVALNNTVEASRQIVQVGMQQRSWPHIVEAKQIVDSGQLGQITLIETHWYQNHAQRRTALPDIDESKLDWQAFLGSAPAQPFDPRRYADWRYYWDFGGGVLSDLFTHWIDVVHWYMASSLPSTASAMGARYLSGERECPDTLDASFLYPGDFQVTFNTSLVTNLGGGGITLRGTEGMLRVERDGYSYYAEPAAYSETMELPLPARQVRIAHDDGTKDHLRNFLNCVRSRRIPDAPVSVGIDAARPGQMGNRSYREKRLIVSEMLPADPGALTRLCF